MEIYIASLEVSTQRHPHPGQAEEQSCGAHRRVREGPDEGSPFHLAGPITEKPLAVL